MKTVWRGSMFAGVGLSLLALAGAGWAQSVPPVETPVPVPAEPLPEPVEELPQGLPEDPTPGALPPASQPGNPPMPDVVVPAPPSGAAPLATGVILGGIDKIAARTARFQVNLKEKVFYNTLIITVYACKTRPPEEPPESAAFLEILESKPDGSKQKLFSGWMFASSPALNALEHPVYDVWVISCKTAPGANTAPVPPNS